MPEWVVHHGDCLVVMAALEPESIDSGVMDPPYGLGFMGAEWDKFGGRGMRPETIAAQKAAEDRNEPFGRSGKAAAPAPGEKAAFKAFMREVATATLRVLKPGAHVLVFGGTRTYHWMADAWEDAGFEVRDMLSWLYGTGFPKNVNIAKSAAKGMGVEPIGREPADLGMANNENWNDLTHKLVFPPFEEWPPEVQEATREWLGWGTALKPACEPLMLARKPIDRPIYRNVLEFRTGAINIDGCRVGESPGWSYPNGKGGSPCHAGGFQDIACSAPPDKGRWPANVIFSHTLFCEPVGTRQVKSGKAHRGKGGGNTFGGENTKPPMEDATYADADGNETIMAWDCVPGCPVAELERQSAKGGMHGAGSKRGGGLGTASNDSMFRGKGRPSASNGTRYGDKGCASRFYYVAKPSKVEKEAGLKEFAAATAAELTGRKEGSAGLVMEHADGRAKANPYAGTSGAVPRKNKHPCLHPNEAVRTDKGWFDIKTISVGDRVLTADGRWNRVVDVSSHHCDGPLYRVWVGDRDVLATGNHPFLIERDGVIAWVEARLLRVGDAALSPTPRSLKVWSPEAARELRDLWDVPVGVDIALFKASQAHDSVVAESRLEEARFLLVENGSDTVKPSWESADPTANTPAEMASQQPRATIESNITVGSEWPTSSSGKRPTDPSLMATESIIGMRTSRTTSCPTSSLSMPLHTSGFTPVASCGMECGGSRVESAASTSPSPRSTGTFRERDGSTTDDAGPATLRRPSRQSSFAAHAIERVEEVPYSGPVWNLTVENSPTFQTRIGMSHNTVKPISLLRYLARLITPAGGTLIDPFAGSGSCGIAAGLEGFNYIGIELDPEGKGYPIIARARIRHHVGESLAAAVVVDPLPAETDPMFRGF